VPSAAGPVPYHDSDAVDPRWRLLGNGALVPDSGATMIAAAQDGCHVPPRGRGPRRDRAKALRAKVS
ncbi:hypothetical protein ABZ366_33915, partial [Streptomyces sp. NPDC005904]|uniref:hypothetical protein n=1 Tax=Streptomyces sp. NPDC005904 TaxID=3154570 RepID=UPI00340D3B06